MDGLAIGLAFQASATVGLLVAAAVIAHDLADGINTVNLSLMGGASGRAARLWLAADAVAPMLGVAAAQAISLPRLALSLLLAALAGALTWVVLGRADSGDGRRRPTVRGALAALIGFGCILGISRALQA
jgi:ZIP family zinc transporter